MSDELSADGRLSAEIATALAARTDLPVEAIALLGALVEARSFMSLYGDSAQHPNLWNGPLTTFPAWVGAPGPDDRPTHAFGGWQWEPATAGDIATGIGSTSVDPDHQITGSWWLAQRDFHTRSGGQDLLKILKIGTSDALGMVQSALVKTWPYGADSGFDVRYRALITAPAPGPAPPPASTPTVTMLPGDPPLVVDLCGWDRNGVLETLPTTGGSLLIDDPSICSVTVNVDGQSVTIVEIASGQTLVHYRILGLEALLQVIVMPLARIAFVPRVPLQLDERPSG